MSELEFQKITQILDQHSIVYSVKEHESAVTGLESAQIRGSKLSEGVKCLLVKFNRQKNPEKEFFILIEIPSDLKVDWKKSAQKLIAKNIGLSTPQEVTEQTGCQIGGVPPFGHKNELSLIVDPKIFLNEYVEFNAGLTTKSIRMKSLDLKKVFESSGAAFFDMTK